ncbi:MAG: hypothetical protein RR201_03190 [Malacoplasma sp.]
MDDILRLLITIVVIPLISLLGGKFIELVGTKVKQNKNEGLIKDASKIVLDSVRTVFQIYVESLKKSDSFNLDEQKNALQKSIIIIKSQLTPKLSNFIKKNYGDLDSWINNQVEATIHTLKKK